MFGYADDAAARPAAAVRRRESLVDVEEAEVETRFLRQQGFTNVLLFAGGFTVWEQAGKPVEKGAAP